MKTIKQIGAQGELLFRRIEQLPDNARELPRTTIGHIVGHSETGHHHVVESSRVRHYAHPTDPFLAYLVVEPQSDPIDVVHHRPWDTHETLRLLSTPEIGETIWEIRKQHEWAPNGWRVVVD